MATERLSRRGVGLITAVLLAAFATAAWMSYVRGVERKAVSGSETVNTWVAKQMIPAGTSADFAIHNNLFTQTPIPRRLLADGAVTNLNQIQGGVSTVTILKGEQIVRARFTSAAEAARLLDIPAGFEAMSVKVDAPPGVAGFIQAHDHVSVLARVRKSQGDQVRFLMQGVEVLAVGSASSQLPPAGARDATNKASTNQSQSNNDTVILTLSVSAPQAEQLGFAILDGDVYFTLLPPGAANAKTPGRTADSLFN
ncbi:MAG: Flp pilus assembly protein CpaB [Actinomycetota bacterium]